MKNNVIAVSIVLLGICIALSGWFIAGGLKEQALAEIQLQEELQQQVVDKQLLTEAEVAAYLGVSEQQVKRLTINETEPGNFTYNMPFIEIDTTKYYPKKAVDAWLTTIQFEFFY